MVRRWDYGEGGGGRDSEFSDPAVKTVLKCKCKVGLDSFQ